MRERDRGREKGERKEGRVKEIGGERVREIVGQRERGRALVREREKEIEGESV